MIQRLRASYGRLFPLVFKAITADNGSEFAELTRALKDVETGPILFEDLLFGIFDQFHGVIQFQFGAAVFPFFPIEDLRGFRKISLFERLI